MTALVLGAIVAGVVIVILLTVKSLLIICPPNRVAVISGRSRQLSDGRTVGYRAIRGGRTMRVPLLEKVAWMELNTIPIEVSVQNAYSAGAIPLNVQGIANVKVSSVEGLLQNSVERFLDVPQNYIAGIAKETLEANLRGVLATLTPEEVNEDRLKFAQTLIDEADDDIKTLGLELDVLKIQNVTDEVGYLDSVGRRQTAEVLKEARVAEAQRQAEAAESEAQSRQRAEIAAAQADLQIVQEENALRVRRAELEALAGAAEAEAKVAGEKARVVAEQQLEAERVQLETRRLEADVVAPARADLEARELAAKADAAKIVEEGNAQVEVFRRLVEQYQAAGDDAQRVFVLRMLPDIIDKIVSTVGGVDIDKVSIIDSGNGGSGIPGFMNQLPASVISMLEQLETATGVDLLRSLRPDGEGGAPNGQAAAPSAPAAPSDQANPAVAAVGSGDRRGLESGPEAD
jgi:flotillin